MVSEQKQGDVLCKVRGLRFTYDESETLLTNVNFELKAGQRVLLIGMNGGMYHWHKLFSNPESLFH